MRSFLVFLKYAWHTVFHNVRHRANEAGTYHVFDCDCGKGFIAENREKKP